MKKRTYVIGQRVRLCFLGKRSTFEIVSFDGLYFRIRRKETMTLTVTYDEIESMRG